MDVLRKVESQVYISRFTSPTHTERLLLRTKLPTYLLECVYTFASVYLNYQYVSVCKNVHEIDIN